KKISGIDAAAREILLSYKWPGNVRELENEIERAVALAKSGEGISVELLSDRLKEAAPSGPLRPLAEAVRSLEVDLIKRALDESDGNKAAAAKQLGLSREGLRKKITRYQIN
ncbi:MAG: AAA-type ATPase lid domain-containing protein, partial [Planctomycetota bacterium]